MNLPLLCILNKTKITTESVLKNENKHFFITSNFSVVVQEPSLVNAGHLKSCFASTAKISSQKQRIMFSNQKNKISYRPKILVILCILWAQATCRGWNQDN